MATPSQTLASATVSRPGFPAPSPVPPALLHFAPEVQAAHAEFLRNGDPASLDVVVLAVVLDHQREQPHRLTRAELHDQVQLVAGLGLDSLALAEIVFFLEDLYRVTISNAELQKIITVGELRQFVQRKVSAVRRA